MHWLSGISTEVDAVTSAGFHKVPYELRGWRGQGATRGGIALPLLKDGRESCTVRVGLEVLRELGGLGIGTRGHIGVQKGLMRVHTPWESFNHRKWP